MRRSEINAVMRDAVEFFATHRFHLPPFAFWRSADWTSWGSEAEDIQAGISDLPAPDGPFIHLKAAQRTKRLFVTASSRFRGRQLSAGGRASH